MSVSAFDYNAQLPTKDAQFKHITSYGSTQLRSAVSIDAYDATQPQARALGNTGAVGYIQLGSNQKSNPVGLYGKDTQYNSANTNRGKLSIKPNIGAPNNNNETIELMGIGADDSNAIGKVMPTGVWIRCRNDAANPVNAAFSLTNIPEGGAVAGKLYTSVCNNTIGITAGQYNMFLTDITASVETNINVIKIEPTAATTANFTITAPPTGPTAPSIILNGNVITQNNAFSGRITTPAGLTSPAILITGMTTNANIMLTCVGASNAGIFYTPTVGQFTITSTGAPATVAYQVIEL